MSRQVMIVTAQLFFFWPWRPFFFFCVPAESICHLRRTVSALSGRRHTSSQTGWRCHIYTSAVFFEGKNENHSDVFSSPIVNLVKLIISGGNRHLPRDVIRYFFGDDTIHHCS